MIAAGHVNVGALKIGLKKKKKKKQISKMIFSKKKFVDNLS
jgi:hypothetical protein